MMIKDPTTKQALADSIAELNAKNADFRQAFAPYQALQEERSRQIAILSAIENEIAEFKAECKASTQQKQSPSLESFIQLKQKEAEFNARKEYIEMFLADCEFKDKQFSIELSPKRVEIISLVDEICLKYANQIIEEQLEGIAKNLLTALLCFERSQQMFEKAKTYQSYNANIDYSPKYFLFEIIKEKIGEILNREIDGKDSFLSSIEIPNELSAFEYISPMKAQRYATEIEKHYQTQSNQFN